MVDVSPKPLQIKRREEPGKARVREDPHRSPGGSSCLICGTTVKLEPVRNSRDLFFATSLNGSRDCRHIHYWRRLNRGERVAEGAEVREVTKLRKPRYQTPEAVDQPEKVVLGFVWTSKRREFRGQPSASTLRRQGRLAGAGW